MERGLDRSTPREGDPITAFFMQGWLFGYEYPEAIEIHIVCSPYKQMTAAATAWWLGAYRGGLMRSRLSAKLSRLKRDGYA